MATSLPGSLCCQHLWRNSGLATTSSVPSPLTVSKVERRSAYMKKSFMRLMIIRFIFSLQGLMNLLNLELGENTLHEGSVSPLTFRPLKKLLHLQLDNNYFRSLPLGLPPFLQVHWYHFTESCWGYATLMPQIRHACLSVCVLFFVFIQKLQMNKNLIEEVLEEALRSCVHLKVLDLNHNQLCEQGIATHAWTHLKYVHPSFLSYTFLFFFK